MRLARALALAAVLASAAPHRASADDPAPTTDLAPLPDPGEPTLPGTEGPTTRSLALSAGATAGIYVGLYGWLTMAWYVRTTDSGTFQTHDEGWFGADTYAGGADKLGHAWGNYFLVRTVHRILRYGGWSEATSVIAASGLALSFFTMSEIKDGYKIEYGFSYGDMICNVAGNALGVLFELTPALDRRFSYRISYLPSSDYLRELERDGPFNTPEDYTGQTFYLSYHLGSSEFLRERADWVKYLDLSVGFRARNYKPEPSDGARRSQELFVGISLDAQAMIAAATGRGPGSSALQFIGGMYQIPYTTLDLGGLERTRDPLTPAARAIEGP